MAARREPPAPPPVLVAGRSPLPAASVVRLVRAVLAAERTERSVSVTFVGPARMRALNRQWKGHDRPTDVLSFSLDGPLPAADLYICPAVASREARERDLPVKQEVARLVIHGTLHALGWDHPETDARERSPMWRRQERYLEAFVTPRGAIKAPA